MYINFTAMTGYDAWILVNEFLLHLLAAGMFMILHEQEQHRGLMLSCCSTRRWHVQATWLVLPECGRLAVGPRYVRTSSASRNTAFDLSISERKNGGRPTLKVAAIVAVVIVVRVVSDQWRNWSTRLRMALTAWIRGQEFESRSGHGCVFSVRNVATSLRWSPSREVLSNI